MMVLHPAHWQLLDDPQDSDADDSLGAATVPGQPWFVTQNGLVMVPTWVPAGQRPPVSLPLPPPPREWQFIQVSEARTLHVAYVGPLGAGETPWGLCSRLGAEQPLSITGPNSFGNWLLAFRDEVVAITVGRLMIEDGAGRLSFQYVGPTGIDLPDLTQPQEKFSKIGCISPPLVLPAMDDEEERRDKREATSGAVAKALTVKEWEQIETISQAVRLVGKAMQAEAESIALTCTAVADVTDMMEDLPFCEEAWCWLRAGGEKVVALSGRGKKPKQGGRRAAMIASLEGKARNDLLEKVEGARQPAAPPPRLETFGKRTEGFAVAMEAWAASRTGRSPLDVVVSCHRAASMLRSRCGEPGTRAADQLEIVAVTQANRAGGAKALLEEAVETPEPLVRPSFAGERQVSLYPEQKEVARILGRSVLASIPLLLRYVTPPSGGKSSAAALFGATLACVLESREGGPRRFPSYVIYACFSNAVRVEVSRTVLAASVPRPRKSQRMQE
jgi:hypothetical protein